jgi:hypothetical protein
MIGLGFRFSCASFVLLSVVSIAVAQANEPTLTVGGSVPQAQRLTAASLSKLLRVTVKAKDHSGKESTFEGVSVVEVLKLAGQALTGVSGGRSSRWLQSRFCLA